MGHLGERLGGLGRRLGEEPMEAARGAARGADEEPREEPREEPLTAHQPPRRNKTANPRGGGVRW